MKERNLLAAEYRKIIESTLDVILKRYERHPEYGFLDTKFDLVTKKDYFTSEEKNDHFRSGGTVYSWIQGRGLESLAGHLNAGFGSRERILPILRTVSGNLLSSRERNGGRMFFMMNPSGDWINPDGSLRREPAAGKANYSDIFVAKGLMSAAAALKDDSMLENSLVWFREVVEAVENREFVTDQQPFDPANPVAAQPGKILQGPFMIALSGIARAAELTGDSFWLDKGCSFLRRVLSVHVKRDCGTPDFFEAVHEDDTPWVEDGKLLCDPGHALEFLGLAQKFLFTTERAGRACDRDILEFCRGEFPGILSHTFRIGFSKTARGIIKSYDLIARKPINSDMPWWNLPETIRAAAENELFSGTDQSEIISLCSDAFLRDFTVPECGCFAWQTRDCTGRPSAAIPAVPDLDPGYHTNLSLIDVISLWEKA